MSIGTIQYRRGPLPHRMTPNANAVPPGEQELSKFSDIEAWVQPDLGNVLVPSPNLHLFTRMGAYDARTMGTAHSIGTGMDGNVSVISLQGNAPPNNIPLAVEGFRLGGSYTLAGVFGIDAAADISNAFIFYSAGIAGTASNLRIYQFNGNVRVRHGTTNNSGVNGVLSAGDIFLLMVTYNADADQVSIYLNSATALPLASDDAKGVVGGDRDVNLCSDWNNTGTGMLQQLDGFCRAAWMARVPWSRPEYDNIRTEFFNKVAALYPNDITLT